MSAPSTTPPTSTSTPTYETSAGWYGGRKCVQFRQRVKITHGQSIIACAWNIPAYSQVVYSHVRNAVTNNAVSGAIGGTAPNGIALIMYPVSNAAASAALTAAPSTASASNPNGTNGIILGITPGTGTSETNGVWRGPPVLMTVASGALVANRNPIDAFLALVPAHTSSNRVQVNSAATDSGYYFGTTNAANTSSDGAVDVIVYVETYADYWS